MSRFEAASPQVAYVSTSSESSQQEMYFEEWTNSSRLLFYSVIIFSLIALPAFMISLIRLTLVKTCNSNCLPYLCAILIANMVLLSTLLGSVMVENSEFVFTIIPGYIVCKVTAFLVNTSSCFIHWTWVAMYAQRFIFVFFPLQARRTGPIRQSIVLLGIATVSGCIQVWTFFFISMVHVYDSDGQVDKLYCGVDMKFSSYSRHLTFIVLIECIITFFVPLILTIISDFSVLFWNNSCDEQFTLVSNNEICDGARKKSNMKIVSKDCLKSTQRKRANAIRCCLISATITLLLNLPNYSLHLADEFLALSDNPSIDVRRMFIKIDAFVYILYLVQFPLTPIHIFLLTRESTVNSHRNSKNLQNSSMFVHT